MVFNERLGYDPDEWEECPEPEHFLVFSPFTRFVLTAAAIAFVYYFFKILDEHKNGPKEVEQSVEGSDVVKTAQTTVEQVLDSASHKFHQTQDQIQKIPHNAEELLREADQYLHETSQPLINKSKQLADKVINKFPSLELDVNVGHPIDATRETFDSTLRAVNNHLQETLNMDVSPNSRDSTQFEQIPSFAEGANTINNPAFTHDFEHVPPHLRKAAEQFYAQQQQHPYQDNQFQFQNQPQSTNQDVFGLQNINPLQHQQGPVEIHQRPPVPQHQQPYANQPISPAEQKLLHEFDIYDSQPQQFSGNFGAQGSIQPVQVRTQYGNIDPSQLSPNSRASYEQQLPHIGERTAFAPVPKKLGREKRLSEQDERAMQDWEQEKALLEADRIRKLLDHEAGGDSNTDLSNSQKAYDRFAPASHISYESRSDNAYIQPQTPTAVRGPHFNDQQQNIQNVGQDPRYQQLNPPQNQAMTNIRDSQLTDYDISDFNAHESHDGWAEPQHQLFQQHPQQQQPLSNQKNPHQQQQQQPGQIQNTPRRVTADSDEYVKVSEHIYDYPPPQQQPQEKRISPTEAAQLQELYQEYDLGLDIPGVKPIVEKPPHQHVQFQQSHGQKGVVPPPFEQPKITMRQDSVPQSPQSVINVPISRRTDVPIQQPHNAQKQSQDTQKNLATADLFVQDALEYLDKPHQGGAFIMEEDMLNSHEAHGSGSRHQQKQVHSVGGEATSRQVRTNEVFERMETDEHDDMTYAPEIQSVEIPPDQMSDTSENMIDYFDKVAADSEAQIRELQNKQYHQQQQQQQQNTLKRQPHNQQKRADENNLLKPAGRAPQILPAFGNRVASNSSIGSHSAGRSGSGVSSSDVYPYRHLRKQSSLLSVLGVTSMQEVLLTINSLDDLSEAMRKAGLETTNLIFGIDYTASNKYQGEESFGGRSLHTIHPHVKNPYQQVITILGRTLAPFAGDGNIGVYGFGDAKTGDWSVFNLQQHGDCRTLDEVLSVYNSVTPTVALSGPTNFAPLIYQAMETCQKSRDYHILVIVADGQVTNERATRRAIVQACQHPLSIIVVGVGDGPWDMMRVFDESLPKRPWDNFHFVEFHEIMKKTTSLEDGDVKLAVQSLLEIPDQYRCICELGLLDRSIPPRGSEIRRELMHNPL